jgi:Rad52/22 family double-strand break repair protein
MAAVRLSISNKNSHEDVGFGEASHESKLKALDTAMKSAITDAMKRAARHFGERLGNGKCKRWRYFVSLVSVLIPVFVALYVAGNGVHTAPKDNKTALRQLKQKEAIELFGDQSLNRELRATIDENREKIEQGQRTPSNSQHEPNQSTLPLEREVTPPSVEVRASSAHLSREGRESSPQQHPGYTKAVTPRQPNSPHYAGGQRPNVADSRTSSPAAASPGVTPTVSLPPLPRSNPLPVHNSEHPSNARATESMPTKRQKVVHNPYQH